MATSVIMNSCLFDGLTGAIDFDTDAFKAFLVNATGAAVADETKKDSHLKRSDANTNEVTGTGYTAGGATVTMTVTKDTANNRLDITVSSVSWTTSTITASGMYVYKSRGGAATADELVCYIDFGASFSSSAGTFSVSSSIVRIQN
jgi:hypothetical protein